MVCIECGSIEVIDKICRTCGLLQDHVILDFGLVGKLIIIKEKYAFPNEIIDIPRHEEGC